MKFFKTVLLIGTVAVCSCAGNKDNTLNYKESNTTGWAYDAEDFTGFQPKTSINKQIPVGMVAIEGGGFSIGERGEFITTSRDNSLRKISVSHFFMDKYEVSNVNWREYVNWLKVVFGNVAPTLVKQAMPDLTVWRDELAYNEPYLQNYYDHPGFNFYPVVGVTWEQAVDFCSWRTDRVNELALIEAGIITKPDFASLSSMSYEDIRDNFVFNTKKYLLSNNYNPAAGKKAKTDISGNSVKVEIADGILQTDFRLPTEAEWMFAAYAPVAEKTGLSIEGRLYPWTGDQPRTLTKKQRGLMRANFVRGRGDMMGMSGALNDGALFTAPVNSYAPNDFGLYNMAGNVNEWVLDVYSTNSSQDINEYNPFRGNVFTSPVITSKDEKGNNVYALDSLGRIVMEANEEDDVRLYKDGDKYTTLDTDYALLANGATPTGQQRLDPTDVLAPKLNEKTRVYKGGSWKDRIYWLNPSTRRYLNQDEASNTIGFRCAMSIVSDQSLDN